MNRNFISTRVTGIGGLMCLGIIASVRPFGLPEANFPQVFPGIANFQSTNLGFMQPPAP